MSRTTPAIERNREPIGDELAEYLRERSFVLEIASGPGAHAAYFADRFPNVTWQPSEVDEHRLGDIRAWVHSEGRDNLLSPLAIDVTEERWPVQRADAVVSINMIHIAPFPVATDGLFRGADRVLGSSGIVVLYGPFFRDGVDTAPSNLAFDESLRQRIPGAGIRQLGAVSRLAGDCGFVLESITELPANNCFAVYSRAS